MSDDSDYELSSYERKALICGNCNQSDRLYKDAHGIFCHRCGPFYPVETREIGSLLRNLSKGKIDD